MSRQPRAGIAGKPVTIRATDAERALWQAAAGATGASSLSDALRSALTTWAVNVLPASKKKSRLMDALDL